jgi:hypothetical protein
MAEVIARVRKEMEDRLREIEAELADVEALIAERAQIQHALAAPPFAPSAAAPPRTSAAKAKPKRARAPRGANRAAVLEAVERMPGASVAELASAAKIGRPQASAVLRALVAAGEVATVELAGGQTGYRVSAEPETAFPKPQEAEASETSSPVLDTPA